MKLKKMHIQYDDRTEIKMTIDDEGRCWASVRSSGTQWTKYNIPKSQFHFGVACANRIISQYRADQRKLLVNVLQ